MDMIVTSMTASVHVVQEAAQTTTEQAPADPAPEPTTSPARTPVAWAGAKPAIGAALAVSHERRSEEPRADRADRHRRTLEP
ncbi:hypothetical protein [Brachybacterium subflavum]|uniref:hypothetical protein n=1 Tax=Brachybacterium subflavum TaxID=2585206 RepID=UPI00126663A7|nr:hypothetical protein [Brachybacterium subflavum]